MITADRARQVMPSSDDFYAIIDSIAKQIVSYARSDISEYFYEFTNDNIKTAFSVVNHLRNHGYHVTPYLNENHEIMSININW